MINKNLKNVSTGKPFKPKQTVCGGEMSVKPGKRVYDGLLLLFTSRPSLFKHLRGPKSERSEEAEPESEVILKSIVSKARRARE
jgi:hypothetical protein